MEKMKTLKRHWKQAVEKIKNLSLRKTILLYMIINVVICLIAASAIDGITQSIETKIIESYLDDSAYDLILEGQMRGFTVDIRGVDESVMSDTDTFIVESLCDFLQTWSVFILTITGTVIAIFLFYRNKIKQPLRALVRGSEMIAQNQLDFVVDYINADELGTLCSEFEFMRSELAENNRRMWKMIEQEKALRSAIAHDIRSPLAVLKGYQEMLIEFIPEDKLDKDKVLEILDAGMGQIERLNDFVETMRRLSRLEDRKVEYMDTTLSALTTKLRDTVTVLAAETDKKCEVEDFIQDCRFRADCFMIMEVAENLVSNALRFARHAVRVRIRVNENLLEICVRDDGKGFEGDAETLTKAYYHANPQDDHVHFGLGLYLCRVYCEKHGGALLFANRSEGGGEVRASFLIS